MRPGLYGVKAVILNRPLELCYGLPFICVARLTSSRNSQNSNEVEREKVMFPVRSFFGLILPVSSVLFFFARRCFKGIRNPKKQRKVLPNGRGKCMNAVRGPLRSRWYFSSSLERDGDRMRKRLAGHAARRWPLWASEAEGRGRAAEALLWGTAQLVKVRKFDSFVPARQKVDGAELQFFIASWAAKQRGVKLAAQPPHFHGGAEKKSAMLELESRFSLRF